MARNTNFLFALLLVIGIAWIALAARGCSGPRVPAFIDPKLTMEEARDRSKESGKPVFVLVAADWCPFCADLKRGALRDSAVQAWIKDNTVPVYVDVTRYANVQDPAAAAVFDEFHVQSIPAMGLWKGGRELGHVEGNIPAGQLLDWLQSTGK